MPVSTLFLASLYIIIETVVAPCSSRQDKRRTHVEGWPHARLRTRTYHILVSGEVSDLEANGDNISAGPAVFLHFKSVNLLLVILFLNFLGWAVSVDVC